MRLISSFASLRIKLWAANARFGYTISVFFIAFVLAVRFCAETLYVSNFLKLSVTDVASPSDLLNQRLYYDESKLSNGINYPVCKRLDSLFQELMEEEKSRTQTELRYQTLYNEDKLYCGQERVFGYLWIFGKKHNVRRSAERCVPQIIDGKRRILSWISDLCAVQEEHNHYWRVQNERNIALNSRQDHRNKTLSDKKRKDQTKSLLQVTSPYRSRRLSGKNESTHSARGSADDLRHMRATITAAAQRMRGIIYTGLPQFHFKNIYQSVLAHRNLKVSLPIEVWVNAADMPICTLVFESLGAYEFLNEGEQPMPAEEARQLGVTTCRALPPHANGFASKYYALLGTQFTDVFFMDADNLAVRDVNEVFNSVEYKRTGAILWPDLWGAACRTTQHRADNGYTGFETSVLWQAHVGGLLWKNVRSHAHEAEAGQLAFDRTRHGGLLELGRRLIEDEQFFKFTVNGDKDIFRLVHLMVDEPFTFIDAIPGYSTANPGGGRDCLTHYFGVGGEAGPGNAIAADTSGAFSMEEELADNASNTTAPDPPVPHEKSMLFKFGSFVGSFFGDAKQRRNVTDCAGAGCSGAWNRERLVSHDGRMVTLSSLSPQEQELHRTEKPQAAAPPQRSRLNGLGKPAGTGWGAPIGTDPMFFHQLKNRNPQAFRFAYRLKEGALDPSVCFDFAAPDKMPAGAIETYKHPSADRLRVFMTKLFLQVDWKWNKDPSNNWAREMYWHTWRRLFDAKRDLLVQMLVLSLSMVGVVLLIFMTNLIRKDVASGPKTV